MAVATRNFQQVLHSAREDARSANYRLLARLLGLLVALPTGVLITVGVALLILGKAKKDYLFGALIVSISLTMIAGTIATFAYLKRGASLSKLQTDFVNKVSHDLRTPLTSIRMFVETLQMGRIQDPARVQQSLDVLAAETARLSQMIDRLLGWARMEAGKRDYQTEREHVGDLVDSALAAFEPQRLQDSSVKIQRDVAQGLPDVEIDLAAMSEALLNLLQNAFKFTGPEKLIGVRARAVPGGVEIEVSDNGPGIPLREQSRIFEKFYRSPNVAEGAIEGSGLGLAIVQHIVEAQRGTVTLHSEPGKGAAFRISLPAAPPVPRHA
jgi:two-component system, OmpR family, phosphate regulon sensor histidine kinase PhoR